MTPIERLEAQPALEPGDEGYWKVWGASYRDIRPGDIIACKSGLDPEGEVHTYEVADTKEWLPGVGIVTPEGKEIGIGGLQPLVVFRWNDRNMLADSVR